jgi:hypothetical protein
VSQHERERFWRAQVRRTPEGSSGPFDLPDMVLPPHDALVLCGYVRVERICGGSSNALYNVRADGRRGALSADSSELRADWLLLYGGALDTSLWRRVDGWFVQTREDLVDLDYPEPRGSAYLCCAVTAMPDSPAWLAAVNVAELHPRDIPARKPFATSWATLIAVASSPGDR